MRSRRNYSEFQEICILVGGTGITKDYSILRKKREIRSGKLKNRGEIRARP